MTENNIHIAIKSSLGKTQADKFNLNVDINLPDNKVTVLFGRSGSGKTTILNAIAGLEKHDHAVVRVGSSTWQDHQHFVSPHHRSIGYVFQTSNLFPHLTVAGNLNFATKRADNPLPKSEAEDILQLLGLTSLLSRYPNQLSGGEQQRVALARALLCRPALLLMDEPLSNLDQYRKNEILNYLVKVKNKISTPIIYVTHSMEEMSRLADYVVLLREGSVIKHGKLKDVLNDIELPLSMKEDIGVVLEATIVEKDTQWHLAKAHFNDGDIWLPDHHYTINQSVRIRILAKDVSLSLSQHTDTSILNLLQGELGEGSEQQDGAIKLVSIRVGEEQVLSRITVRSYQKLNLQPGTNVWLQIKSVAVEN